MLLISYVLPIKMADDTDFGELGGYLRTLSGVVDDVVLVDGSSDDARRRHAAAVGPAVRVLEPRRVTPMGKVGGVLTGVQEARHEQVVIADDDVRYRLDQLEEMAGRLQHATVVRPQNHYDPLTWPARVDTARTLLARVSGGDWPGTLAIRRSALLEAGGYAGDVIFENLELVRTLVAAGGTEQLALDVVVRRLPPTASHFRSQQVRQAYDELARPARMAISLLVAPLAVAARRRPAALLAGAAVPMIAAEVGRRRAGGRAVYPASSVPFAAPWLLWRSVCSWAALGAWLRGGVRYRDVRLRRAATSERELARRLAERRGSMDRSRGAEMKDIEIVQMINELADEERNLEGSPGSPGLSDEQRSRLHEVEVALDQCWDLLRQRRARRAVGEDPDEAEVRPASTVETYLQ